MPWRVGAPDWFSCSPGPRPEESDDSLGVTLLELIVATLLGTTLLAMATPAFQRLATAQHERLAVRYVVAEVMLARAQAARRGTSVGIRFGRDMRGYYFGTYVDGNGNGLRATDVRRGIDQPIGPTRRLEEARSRRPGSKTATPRFPQSVAPQATRAERQCASVSARRSPTRRSARRRQALCTSVADQPNTPYGSSGAQDGCESCGTTGGSARGARTEA